MAAQALSTIGVIFGWGVETVAGQKPAKFKEIEECTNIGGVETTSEKLDSTPLKSKKKRYVKGHEDTGGELPTTFNYTDTFETQWGEMYAAYETAKEAGLGMWFTAYHPSKKNANFYIVEPGSIPAPEYGVGNVLQVTISNTLVDLPDASAAIKPEEPTTTNSTPSDEQSTEGTESGEQTTGEEETTG